jgi:predicted peptidase
MREHAPMQAVEADPLRYVLSRPARPRSETGPPAVLCFLHGYGEAAPLDLLEGVTRHGPLRTDSDWRLSEEFTVIAPQLPEAGDHWRRYADAVADIVREVQQVHGADARHTYLTGFSYGGNGVFDLALAQPDLWAALWPVDPTRLPERDPGRPVWLSIGAAARPKSAQFIEALGLQPADPMATGERLYTDEGLDHTGCAEMAYRTDQIYEWLLMRHL